MGFFCRMKVGTGGIVYASAWVLADMDMDTAELGWDGWDGVEWAGLGGKFPLSPDRSGRTDVSHCTIQSSIGRYDIIRGGRRKQPVDGWVMIFFSFFSRPSLFLYVDDGRYLYDLIPLN